MLIYPTIEIQDGRCVSLDKGRLDEPLIWHVDPVGMAQSFAKAGAAASAAVTAWSGGSTRARAAS